MRHENLFGVLLSGFYLGVTRAARVRRVLPTRNCLLFLLPGGTCLTRPVSTLNVFQKVPIAAAPDSHSQSEARQLRWAEHAYSIIRICLEKGLRLYTKDLGRGPSTQSVLHYMHLNL